MPLLPSLLIGLSGCLGGPGRGAAGPVDEAAITTAFMELIPDGRVFTNNLSANEPQQIAKAFLFDREIVVEDDRGRLTSVRKHTLDPKWVFTGIPGPSEFEIVPGPLTLGVVSGGVLYEVDRKYGTQRSAHVIDFIPSAAPAITDSSAYIPALASRAGHRTLISMGLVSGVEGWGLSTRGSISSKVVAGVSGARQRLYFVTEKAGVFCYPAVSASSAVPDPAWTHAADGRIVCAPLLDRDLLLVGSEKGELWALDRITGTPIWAHYSKEPIQRTAWSSGDQVYFANARGFHALDRETGRAIWSKGVITVSEHEIIAEPLTFVVRRADAVYVKTSDGWVFALDPANGELLRFARFDRDFMFLTNLESHVLYMVTPSGFIFAVDEKL